MSMDLAGRSVVGWAVVKPQGRNMSGNECAEFRHNYTYFLGKVMTNFAASSMVNISFSRYEVSSGGLRP